MRIGCCIYDYSSSFAFLDFFITKRFPRTTRPCSDYIWIKQKNLQTLEKCSNLQFEQKPHRGTYTESIHLLNIQQLKSMVFTNRYDIRFVVCKSTRCCKLPSPIWFGFFQTSRRKTIAKWQQGRSNCMSQFPTSKKRNVSYGGAFELTPPHLLRKHSPKWKQAFHPQQQILT